MDMSGPGRFAAPHTCLEGASAFCQRLYVILSIGVAVGGDGRTSLHLAVLVRPVGVGSPTLLSLQLEVMVHYVLIEGSGFFEEE